MLGLAQRNDLLTGMVLGKPPKGRQKTGLTNTLKERLELTILRPQQQPKTQPFGKRNVLIDSSSSMYIKI